MDRFEPGHGFEIARRVMGLRFPTPVGLAAGYDRDGSFLRQARRIGFGFVEVGTLSRDAAGSRGPLLGQVEHNVRMSDSRGCERRPRQIVGVNLGVRPDTPLAEAHQDYLACIRAVWNWADYAVLNLTSDASRGLREPRHRAVLLDILRAAQELAVELCRRTMRRVPLLIKLPLATPHDPMFEVAQAAVQLGFDGIVADQAGPGTPGPTLTRLASALPARAAIVSVGGIDTGRTALERLNAGAHLIQTHRGFAQRGPELIAEILRTLMLAAVG